MLIGILISAPMGPIGMFVIQRTLNKGRLPALYTGLGAALSDLVYCLLTGLGLSFVTDFIESNQEILQIIGSAMILVYAFYLFFHNPSHQIVKPELKASSRLRDVVTGFIFTFANPLILFFIIGLFARFNFLAPEFAAWHYVAGYMAIIGGAVLWWWGITHLVDRMRSHFNVRSTWIINRVLAVILIIMSLVGTITGVLALHDLYFNPA